MIEIMYVFENRDLAVGFAAGIDRVNDAFIQVDRLREYDNGCAVIVIDSDADAEDDKSVVIRDCREWSNPRRVRAKYPVDRFR